MENAIAQLAIFPLMGIALNAEMGNFLTRLVSDVFPFVKKTPFLLMDLVDVEIISILLRESVNLAQEAHIIERIGQNALITALITKFKLLMDVFVKKAFSKLMENANNAPRTLFIVKTLKIVFVQRDKCGAMLYQSVLRIVEIMKIILMGTVNANNLII